MLSNTEAAAAIKTFDTEVVEMLLTLAEGERRRLVNLYTGADRTEKIARNDAVTAVLQEELDRRADDDLLAAIAISPDFVQVQDAVHLAYLLDTDEETSTENLSLSVYEAAELPQPNDNRDYRVGQRIILIDLPHIGATVRSVYSHAVGIDYDNDGALRGTHEAIYAKIRPMPLH